MKSLKWAGLLVAMVGLSLWIGLSAWAQTQNACADDIAEFCNKSAPLFR